MTSIWSHIQSFSAYGSSLLGLTCLAYRGPIDRLIREVKRQLHLLPEALKAKMEDLLRHTRSILIQRTKEKNKLYILHAPKVEGAWPRTSHHRWSEQRTPADDRF